MDPEASPVPDASRAPLAPGYAFELPTAREVVGRGLQLAVEHASALRRASLYIGLLVLVTAGPVALLFLVDLPTLITFPWLDPASMTEDQAVAFLGVVGPLYLAGSCALLGLVAVSVDGVLTAVALLGSRAAGRPLTLRECVQRARQSFWRYGFAAFVVGIVSTIASSVVGLATGAFGRPESIGSNLLGTLAATIVTAPFGYVLTAVVIGDVDGGAALRRSVTLARARPRLAVVVAVFAFLASTLEVLGIGVAFDLADEVGTVLHPSLDLGGTGLILLVPVAAAALVAFGSLALTVSAISAAPQITAFLGLTHYSAGFDRARMSSPAESVEGLPPQATSGLTEAPTEPSDALPRATPTLTPPLAWQAPRPAERRPARWITLPMLALMALEWIVVAGAIGSPHAGTAFAPGGQNASGDPMVQILEDVTGRSVSLGGTPLLVDDPPSDQTGGGAPEADLLGGEAVVVRDVPPWMLTYTFSCDRQDVACDRGGQRDGAFDAGAVLVALAVDANHASLVEADDGECGPLFAIPGLQVAPSSDSRFPHAADAVITTRRAIGYGITMLRWDGSRFIVFPTSARSRWTLNVLLTVIPITDLGAVPNGWDGTASINPSGFGVPAPARDWLHATDGATLPFAGPPVVTFAQPSFPGPTG